MAESKLNAMDKRLREMERERLSRLSPEAVARELLTACMTDRQRNAALRRASKPVRDAYVRLRLAEDAAPRKERINRRRANQNRLNAEWRAARRAQSAPQSAPHSHPLSDLPKAA